MLSVATDNQSPAFRAFIIAAAIVFVIGQFIVAPIIEARKRRKKNLALLQWAQANGVTMTFGDPPPEANQPENVLVTLFKNSDNPFFHPAYDLAGKQKNLFFAIRETRPVWLLTGWRSVARTSYPETQTNTQLCNAVPNGQIFSARLGDLEYPRQGYSRSKNPPSGFTVNAADAEEFSRILTGDFLNLLAETKCRACEVLDGYLQISFDETFSIEIFAQRASQVIRLAEVLESESSTSFLGR